jgi:outer membrane protease
MKNIYGFTVLVSIFFCSPSAPLRAESAYSFSLSSSFGIIYGHSKELVYKYAGKDTLRSELIWDLKPLFYTGAAMDFSRTNPWERWGFFAAASLKYGFPSRTGVIVDWDWNDKDYDYLTHYSRHDAYSQGALLSDASLGFSFPFLEVLALKTGIGFSYMYFSWLAQDGFTQYAKTRIDTSGNYYHPWNPEIPKIPVSGPGIIYSQHWFIFSPVLALGLRLSPRFSLDIYASATPFVFCAAVDDHPARKLRFQDYLSWGLFLEEGIGLVFTPAERFELRLDWGFRHIGGSRGETYQKPTGEGSSSFSLSGEAGAGLYMRDVEISAKIRL